MSSPKRQENGVALTWKDLTVVVSNQKTVLHRLSGVAEPGHLLAIMGPSGGGKSTLLHSLLGRPSRDAIVTGQIMLNGRKAKDSYGNTAYLAQEVPLLGTLTVYETVYYSAKLRFPDSMSEEETRRRVQTAIADVGLKRSMHTYIGNWQRRGLSGGEKRRVSIAIELLTSPDLVFLDEPTSGLDSASAYHVISTLKTLASDGRTVIASIHQPSSEVFELFDDLCLLSGGRQVYFGSVPGALQFFENTGFPCPALRNPSDHYLLTVNSDFDHVLNIIKESAIANIRSNSVDLEEAGGIEAWKELTGTEAARRLSRSRSRMSSTRSHSIRSQENVTAAETVRNLMRSFSTSKERQEVDTRIQQISKEEGNPVDGKSSHASFFTQSYILTKRSFVNMYRDMGYYWARLAVYTVLALTLGTLYYDVGYSYTAIQARGACMTFAVTFLTFMCVGGFPSFIEELKVFSMERANKHYGVGAYVLGNTISSIPFIFFIAIVSSAITYFLAGFHHGAIYFIYYALVTFACLMVSESLIMAVASLVSNFMLALVLGAGLQGIYMLVGGYYRLPNDIPDPVWKYPMYYISFHHYGYQGLYQNDFRGLTFENLNPSDPRITGEYILENNYQIPRNLSKWWDLAILFFMAFGYRIFFYGLIRMSESVFPDIKTFIMRRVNSLGTRRRTKAAPENTDDDE